MKNLIEQSQFEVSNEENVKPAESELNTSCINITSMKSNWCKVMSDDTWVIYEAFYQWDPGGQPPPGTAYGTGKVPL